MTKVTSVAGKDLAEKLNVAAYGEAEKAGKPLPNPSINLPITRDIIDRSRTDKKHCAIGTALHLAGGWSISVDHSMIRFNLGGDLYVKYKQNRFKGKKTPGRRFHYPTPGQARENLVNFDRQYALYEEGKITFEEFQLRTPPFMVMLRPSGDAFNNEIVYRKPRQKVKDGEVKRVWKKRASPQVRCGSKRYLGIVLTTAAGREALKA
jgi:hypothetical protein